MAPNPVSAPILVQLYGGPRDGETIPLHVLPYPHEVLIAPGPPPLLVEGQVYRFETVRYIGPYRHPGREHLRYEFAPEP